MGKQPLLSPAQVRAARGWLFWSQEDLAARSGVSQKSIARYELERSTAYPKTLIGIREAFEAAGIEFQFDGMMGTGLARCDRTRLMPTSSAPPRRKRPAGPSEV
jgi:transcriptional regulator with XRE-family HTH domain